MLSKSKLESLYADMMLGVREKVIIRKLSHKIFKLTKCVALAVIDSVRCITLVYFLVNNVHQAECLTSLLINPPH